MYPTEGTADYLTSTKTYYYWLELDVMGNVIGGEWTNANQSGGFADHPDFLWSPNTVTFEGYYSAIGEIYQQSRK
jgi:hypothetical protein